MLHTKLQLVKPMNVRKCFLDAQEHNQDKLITLKSNPHMFFVSEHHQLLSTEGYSLASPISYALYQSTEILLFPVGEQK